MTDENGRIQWEKIMESFENPALRRRWISSLTNFVAEWISHVSDPSTQQRYLNTAQFVGNSFLKSQGYPKAVMFEPARPVESLSRLVNAVLKDTINIVSFDNIRSFCIQAGQCRGHETPEHEGRQLSVR